MERQISLGPLRPVNEGSRTFRSERTFPRIFPFCDCLSLWSVAKKQTVSAWSQSSEKFMRRTTRFRCKKLASKNLSFFSLIVIQSLSIQRRKCPYIRSCYQTQRPATRSPVVHSELTSTQLPKHVRWSPETEMRKRFRRECNGFRVFFKVRTIRESYL